MRPYGAGHGKGQGYNACMCGYCRNEGPMRTARLKAAKKAARYDAQASIKEEAQDSESPGLKDQTQPSEG